MASAQWIDTVVPKTQYFVLDENAVLCSRSEVVALPANNLYTLKQWAFCECVLLLTVCDLCRRYFVLRLILCYS